MARTSRKVSISGCYHLVFRGNGKQILFEDADDYETFLAYLKEELDSASITLLAWCLMSNHVHLCIRDDSEEPDVLGHSMHRLATRYAMYFNAKTGHVGHVFQGRYSSAPIEEEAYLLETVRYIHNNPEKAGLCSADEYRWSSYQEYMGKPGLCETAGILKDLGGPAGFAEFIREGRQKEFRPLAERHVRISDDEAACIASAVYPDLRLDDVKSLPLDQRNAVLIRLRSEGISIRQLERLTGIGRNVISRAVGRGV